MSQYLLLLHEEPADFTSLSPEEMQGIIEKYRAWNEGMAAAGHIVGGNKLEDGTGHSLRREQGELRVLDGPFAETKEVIGGYFLIRAESYEHAIELSSDCPHLDYDGRIEIRRIDEA